MKKRSETESQSRVIETTAGASCICFDSYSQGCQHVGAAAPARRGAVAVLDYWHARPRRDESRGGTNVEGLRAVTARAARVEHPVASRFEPNHVLPQNRGSRGNLDGGLALHAQGNQYRCRFRLAPMPHHDLTDREAHLLGAQVAALDQRGKTLGESQGRYGCRRGHGAFEAS